MSRISRTKRGHINGLVGAATIALLLGALGGTAQAAPGETDSDNPTTANVVVGTAISLTGLPASFNIGGNPPATVTSLDAVSMLVTTNNAAGYTVTAQSGTETMAGTITTAPQTVPIAALTVRDGTSSGAYLPMSSADPVLVHTQAVPSAEDGDTITSDYQIHIPFVRQDTYSAILTYVATTL